jgi:hypothetical protein
LGTVRFAENRFAENETCRFAECENKFIGRIAENFLKANTGPNSLNILLESMLGLAG